MSNTAEVNGHKVRAPEDYTPTFDESPDGLYELYGVEFLHPRTHSGTGMAPNIKLEFMRGTGESKPCTVENLQDDLFVAVLQDAFHEAIEWIAVDGERIGNPHPEDEAQMWAWMKENLLGLVQEYRARWPE